MRDPRPTAGVVIIGNEILSGKVDEANAAFFVRRLRELGTRLRRITFVPDDTEDVAATVRSFSERFDVVFTTGGIGPTHDDLTMESVALAFGVLVVESDELVERMRKRRDDGDLDEGYRRMARVPEGSVLVGDVGSAWPTVRMRNVYVLPGVPWLLRSKFGHIEEAFRGAPVWLAEVLVAAPEAEICQSLDEVAAAHEAVEIGSYPRFEDGRWSLRITVESTTPDAVEAVMVDLAAAMGTRLVASEPITIVGPDDAD